MNYYAANEITLAVTVVKFSFMFFIVNNARNWHKAFMRTTTVSEREIEEKDGMKPSMTATYLGRALLFAATGYFAITQGVMRVFVHFYLYRDSASAQTGLPPVVIEV